MSTDFLSEFNMLDKRVQKAAQAGMAKAGMALLQDAVMDIPKVPHDEGTLRGSGSVHINGKLKSTSTGMSDGGSPTPFEGQIGSDDKPDAVIGRVGFNTPYAARLHEGVDFHFHEEGTGAKFLERKQAEKGDEYLKIVRDTIVEGMRR